MNKEGVNQDQRHADRAMMSIAVRVYWLEAAPATVRLRSKFGTDGTSRG